MEKICPPSSLVSQKISTVLSFTVLCSMLRSRIAKILDRIGSPKTQLLYHRSNEFEFETWETNVFFNEVSVEVFCFLGPLHMVPGFTDSVASAMQKMQINLNNSAAVLTLNTPLLILHSEDDKVIPVELGRKLYANVKHRVPPVSLVTFAAELGYGHKGIYKDPEIPRIVNDFFEACRRHKGLTKEITIGKDMKSEHTTDV